MRTTPQSLKDDAESMFPKVLVRKINLCEDINFFVGTVRGREFPKTIGIDIIEYILVNFGENEISYLKATALAEPVYPLIYRIGEQVVDGAYMYPFEAQIFETEEEAQAEADEMSV